MASAEECKGFAEVFGVGKLLQIVCQEFCKSSKTPNEMTRKEIKWSWEEKQQRAFEELKERFTTEPVLL